MQTFAFQAGPTDRDFPACGEYLDVVHKHIDQRTRKLPAIAFGVFWAVGLGNNNSRLYATSNLLPLPLDNLPVRHLEVGLQVQSRSLSDSVPLNKRINN